MSLLHVLREEEIAEDGLEAYYDDLYRVVCVGERLSSPAQDGGPVRTTYIVDWEQLVHLLEDYTGLGEDIVEVARVGGEEAGMWRCTGSGTLRVARA